MIRWTASFAALLMLAGCPAPPPSVGGEGLWQHFPFDGSRTWEYISTDTDLSYKLVGKMRAEDPDPEVSEDYNIYHIDYSTKCVSADPDCIDDEIVRTLGISSDVTNGTLLHNFSQGSADLTFDPPLVIAPKESKVGEAVATATDGTTWNATLIGFEPCDNVVRMQGDDFAIANCSAHLLLEDADTNPDTNYGIAGDYWVAKGLGIAGISLEGDDEHVWGLSKLTCEETDDRSCDGTW